MKKYILAILLVSILFALKPDKPATNWYKGNTHCHSTISDGDNPPYKVVQAYHNHGYHFLVLTDHNFLVDMDTVKIPQPMRKDFLLIPGEEVTDQQSVHTTAFNISEYVPFSNDKISETEPEKRIEEILKALKKPNNLTKTEMLQYHVDGILKAGGIPVLNHPNFSDGLQVEDIYPVENLHHLELYNGHPSVANWGKKGHISVEAKWDSLLSRGREIYGIASDDEHDLETRSLKDANPFRGWIMVRSAELTPNAIQESIAKGDFYASTSVTLKTCEMNAEKCVIEVDENGTMEEVKNSQAVPRSDETGEEGFLIEFIGANGKVLHLEKGLTATYQPKLQDKYVRGRVTYCTKTDKGFEKLFAWTQPVFMN